MYNSIWIYLYRVNKIFDTYWYRGNTNPCFKFPSQTESNKHPPPSQKIEKKNQLHDLICKSFCFQAKWLNGTAFHIKQISRRTRRRNLARHTSHLLHCHSKPAGCDVWSCITELMSPQWVSLSLPCQPRLASLHLSPEHNHITAGREAVDCSFSPRSRVAAHVYSSESYWGKKHDGCSPQRWDIHRDEA